MKTIAWFVAGSAMLALSSLLESIGDAGGSPGERLPLYLPALAALIGAPFCFFRGIRSALSEIIGANSDKPKATKPAATEARPAQRLADIDTADTGDAFDADAAFARYMEKRAAQPAAEPVTPPATTAERQPPITRPTFGRRVT
ncbi:hypothetical protein [Erythrobacter sp.]|uniref:hypothetical protein n=1 Tax=Erythrobacter sp. TaxID=1042 RepID=UPI0025D4B499|nr:hypothetical protein [Erythrobacter sp.]